MSQSRQATPSVTATCLVFNAHILPVIRLHFPVWYVNRKKLVLIDIFRTVIGSLIMSCNFFYFTYYSLLYKFISVFQISKIPCDSS